VLVGLLHIVTMMTYMILFWSHDKIQGKSYRLQPLWVVRVGHVIQVAATVAATLGHARDLFTHSRDSFTHKRDLFRRRELTRHIH